MGTLSSPDKRIRGSAGVKLRKRRLARTGHLCEHCKAKGLVRVATVVNHIKPLAHGGEDVDENTENLCFDCDSKVTAEQFGTRIKQAIGADGWPC
jgi:5-methylcytosine-specific restriction protein A